MDGFQPLIRFADLTEFTKRCLVVIGDFRTLRLIHKGPVFSFRIGTALKHIISEEVTAGCQFDISHGVNTLIGENKAVVVGAGHAAAHLTAGVGTVFRPVGRLKVAGHDCIIVVVVLINIFFGNRMFAPFCVEKPRR